MESYFHSCLTAGLHGPGARPDAAKLQHSLGLAVEA